MMSLKDSKGQGKRIPNMLVQHHRTCMIKKCWMRLRTMLDGVGPEFFRKKWTSIFSQKMLNECLNQFKHSSNISLAFFHVGS